MKKYSRFTFVLAAFAATSILACLPPSSASTSASSSSAPSQERRNFFGRLVSKKERTGKDESDGDDDDNEGVEVTITKKKTSWQFFYRKTEDDTAKQKEEDPKNDSESKESRDDEEEDGEEDQKPAQEGTSAEDAASGNSEKNDDQGDIEDGDEASSPSDSKNENNEEDDVNKTEKTKNDGKVEGQKEKDPDQGKESGEKNTNSVQQQSQDPNQQYRNMLIAQQMQQQRLMSPGSIIYRTVPSMSGHSLQQQQQQSGMLGQGQAMSVAAIVNLISLAVKFAFAKWIINKLVESESKNPVHHFMWECLNDTYVKDDEVWSRVLSRVPHSMGISRRKWGQTVKSMVPNLQKEEKKKDRLAKKNRNNKKKKVPKNRQLSISTNDEKNQQKSTEIKPYTPPETSKTVVVMDFSAMHNPQSDFLRFADVVTFLVKSNQPQKQMFGQKPEVILTLQSPGGEVTSFGFAAAQVARLRDAGWNVTVCVDRIAASGGYMIASQATQILASPFAMVGSVGVITESFNFYEILKKNGIRSLVMKAGDSKNPITQFGEVTDEDIKNTQQDLDDIHKSFIELCRSRRPALDLAVCNGRILSGDMALKRGMIDRILTSDEYILEKISEGDLVMKLHLVSGNSERHMIANIFNILPHLKSRFKKFMFAGGGKSMIGKLNAAMDSNFAAR